MRTFKTDNEKLVRNIENLEDTALINRTEIEKLNIELSNLKTEITKLFIVCFKSTHFFIIYRVFFLQLLVIQSELF
jgi:hypothetical protein